MFDKLFVAQGSIKFKQLQGQYSNLNDLNADMSYLQQSLKQVLAQNYGLQENQMVNSCLSSLSLDKYLSVAADIFFQTNQQHQNKLKILSDQNHQAKQALQDMEESA